MLDSPLHEHHLLRYKVDMEDRPMRGFTKTAIVSFFDESDKKVIVLKYGVITKEEIFDKINKGEDINLNSAYVYNFSLTDYRVDKGLDDSVLITLKNFSAKKAFFDCDIVNDFTYTNFEGDKVIFDSVIFGNGTTNFSNSIFCNGDVSFKKAKFGSGSTNFQSVQFGDGLVVFNNTNFGTGNLSFVDCNFSNGNVDFRNTYFGDGHVDFKFAKFAAGDLSFEKAAFGKGKKDFKNVEFGGGKIDFRRVDFNDGDVSYDGAEFGDGKVSFRSARFGHGEKTFAQADFAKGEAQFDLTEFGSGSVSFNKATVTDISLKGCALNCYIDLRFHACRTVDLSNTIVRDILDLKPEDETVAIKIFDISGMRILGRMFIDWRANNVYNLIYEQKETTLFQKAEQFRILKENFRNNGQYEDEDAAYLEFKRCEAKANLDAVITKDKKNALWAYPNFYFQKYVFDYVGRYATDPIRVLSNMFLAFTGFSFIYYIITEHFPNFGTVATTLPTELQHIHSFGNCVYYSAITFFTIGYGDYFAEGYLKPFAAFEGFTGVFLMSYFTVAFVRKILR
ncbi:MAG TPA: potassium channel family protein [Bacteroidia bacterium]|nr:potassium channel family protein [Bacteroidia bacterium]